MSDQIRNKSKRRLWGRAKGRPLSTYQTSLVDRLLPLVALPSTLKDVGVLLRSTQTISLEIGFGGAEHLLHKAGSDRDGLYIGVEPFLNGIAKALAGIDKAGLENVRLHHGDVRDVLDRLPDACLDNVYILFPDPWPKPRHFKRRLIQEELIEQVYRVLKPGGKFYFASDITSYVDWALIRILRYRDVRANGFDWPASDARDWMQPYQDWPGTRYEAKALREGRKPHYFTFIKPGE
ncbi:MAG: tRNA (guanosine(46)-N7)-methyltransferase TrmB [Acidimicrobiales bacterium]|nr:tRNA (guanosine(46)-N7)-methyltransferase TrmB [Hyphomonadaceae bacterium]RZV45086.1 MAG: tRNA (guanosine(46)-N7)-methyltransferase TrmB [Acidimicrobiales bacterium]